MVSTPAAQRHAASTGRRRRLSQADSISFAVALVLAGGVLLRIRAYAADRSLWLDESFLALNLLRRGWSGMLGQLDFNQGAGPGFLLAEKGAAALGTNELMLRLEPFLLGLATLGLILPVARRVCFPAAVPLACALMAFAPSLIYFSTELKQYSGDVASFLVLAWAGLMLRDGVTRRTAVFAAAGGTLAILLSQPAVFAAAGIGAVLLCADVLRRRFPPLTTIAVVATWAGASTLVLVHTFRASSGVLRSFGSSASVTGANGANGTASPTHAFSVLPTSVASDLGLPTSGLEIKLITYVVGIVAIAGVVSLLRRRPATALIVAGPTALMVAASAAGHYPVSGRTVLFVVPAAALFLAEGVAVTVRAIPMRLTAALAACALVVLALEGGVRSDAHAVAHPVNREDVRSILRSVAALKRAGDRLFVVYNAQYALAYYGECGCAGRPPWRLLRASGGTSQWAPALRSTSTVEIEPYLGRSNTAYLRGVRALPSGRTWVLLSHVADAAERRFLYGRFLTALDARGTRLASVRAPGALAVLYALR